MKTKETLKIEYVPIDSLKPYDNNAKIHTGEQVQQIMNSIEMFGFNDPIAVWGGANEIIEGHGRLMAAKELNMTEVPIMHLDELSDEERRAYMLAHNQLTMNTGFNMEILDAEIELLDIDMQLLGFDIQTDSEPEEIIEDEVPDVPEEPKSKLGDVYRLGDHVLMCGDSTDPETVEILMRGGLQSNELVKADMVFTDPPYNMHYDGAGIIKETVRNVRERIKDIVDFNAFDISYLAEIDAGSIYIFTSKDLIPDYFKIFDGWKFNILTWVKTNNPPMTNNVFLPDIEYLLYFHKGERIWNNGLKPMDIYRKAYFSSRQEGHGEIGDVHPTMKPLKLISDKIKISSTENGVVLDVFGGSGSTLIACEQLNRKCYMMELDPKYCDVIIQRWENFTGQKAEKIR